MSKYVFLLKTQLSQIATYREDLVFNWLFKLFQMLVVYALWSISQQEPEELSRLFVYYTLFFLFFDSFTTAKISRWMSKDIMSGNLSTYLLKPINYPITLWIKQIALIVARVIIPIVLFLIFLFIRPDIAAPSSIINLVVFIISTIMCMVIWNLFVTIIGLFSFWINEVSQLQNVINLLLNIVIGRYIPLYLFPENLQNLIALTPANYLGGFQIQAYQGFATSEQIVQGFFVMSIWTLVFTIFAWFLYSKGVKVYEANGS
ncbi:MAG: ABC-2 family transporter protein [Candidatus Doudnabacteria bacterium]|nr:ABC-2 family transporter protein [Candidatus Doudnabacteria bacterium]